MIAWLKGNKTYLGAIGWGILGISHAQGWISDVTAETIAAFLIAWTGVALRAAWKKQGASRHPDDA